ncbi:sterile alpha motif domain-containing protein 1-like [Ammospiza caudacuta]|uniref:sterile alpha motif domain-containing protein 1-like n=1 Tax=Ammospiza caudacuta TaxID=2857398 RepID=UPI00273A18F1|nr:sterile alpha motif domain-containing protein 1-like [Ammospiza caudacuta]
MPKPARRAPTTQSSLLYPLNAACSDLHYKRPAPFRSREQSPAAGASPEEAPTHPRPLSGSPPATRQRSACGHSPPAPPALLAARPQRPRPRAAPARPRRVPPLPAPIPRPPPPARGGGEKGGRRLRATGVPPLSPGRGSGRPGVRSEPGPRTIPALQARPVPHHRAPAARPRAGAEAAAGERRALGTWRSFRSRRAPRPPEPGRAPPPRHRRARRVTSRRQRDRSLRGEEPSDIQQGQVLGPAPASA